MRWIAAAACSAALLAMQAGAHGADSRWAEASREAPAGDGSMLAVALAPVSPSNGTVAGAVPTGTPASGAAGAGGVGPQNLIIDPQVKQAASSVAGWEYESGPAPVMMTQPTNWISGPYLKAGPTFTLGDDLLETQKTGYTISGGYRAPIGPAFGDRTFLDLGGSYLLAAGRTTRLTSGVVTTTVAGIPIVTVEPDLFLSTIREVQRGGVHAGLGWYWGDAIDNRSDDPQFRIATRIGGRLAHVRGKFLPDVAQEVPEDDQTFRINYSKTDTSAGLYVGVETLLLARDLSIGSVAFVVDGEFANDWVNFKGFHEGSLVTAAVTCGVMFSR